MFAARVAIDEACPGGETAPPPTPPVPAVQPQIQTPVPGEPGQPAGEEGTPAGGEPGQPQVNGNTADAIRIDAHPTGNTATSLGSVEFCRDVQPGDRFDVDIVIENVTNLLAFDTVLSYDDSVLRVVDADVDFLLSTGPTSDLLDMSDEVPDSDGVYEVRALDSSADPEAAESGTGILARLTLEADGAGLTTVSIAIPNISPSLTDVDGDALQPADEFGVWQGDVFDAQIAVGELCPEAPPPTAAPTPSPAAPGTPTADDDDGDDSTAVWVIVGVLAGIAALLAAFVTWRRLRGRAL